MNAPTMSMTNTTPILGRTSVRGLRALPTTTRVSVRSSKSCRCVAVDPSDTSPPASKPSWAADWVPEEASPIVSFLTKTDFDFKTTPLYDKLAVLLEDATFTQSVGFKSIPETVNGRAAMIGFVALFGAEIFGQGPFLLQLAESTLPIFVVMSLITAASIIPIVKGTEGDYLDSLDDTFPKDLLIPEVELFHGRLAMVGISGVLLIEVLKGGALF